MIIPDTFRNEVRLTVIYYYKVVKCPEISTLALSLNSNPKAFFDGTRRLLQPKGEILKDRVEKQFGTVINVNELFQ